MTRSRQEAYKTAEALTALIVAQMKLREHLLSLNEAFDTQDHYLIREVQGTLPEQFPWEVVTHLYEHAFREEVR